MYNVLFMSEQNNPNFYKQLGARIAQIRKEQNITQESVATELHISQQTYAAYEIARRRIPVSSLMQLAEILHTDVYELLDVKNSSKKPGPVSKIERLSERIKKLSLEKQKKVLEHLELVIKGAEKE